MSEARRAAEQDADQRRSLKNLNDAIERLNRARIEALARRLKGADAPRPYWLREED